MEQMKKIVLIIAGIMILIALLITSVFSVSFNDSFYEKEYTLLSTAESLDMEEEELMDVTTEMVKYLKGNRSNLHIDAVVGGETVEFFNEREILHMVDVLKLANTARIIRTVFIIIGIGVVSLVVARRGKRGMRVASQSFLISEAIMLGLGIALGLFILSGNFDVFWIKFHELVFTNDLWLLDPRTDRLINLVPEHFFYHLCLRSLAIFILGTMVLSGLAIWGIKSTSKTEGK